MEIKKRVINISVKVLVTLIMLLICELIIRSMYKDKMVLFPRYHTDVTYGEYTIRGNRPNMNYTHTSVDGEFDFVINSKGCRNEKDIPYEKGDKEVRLLCIGDSHTIGFEVKQSQVYSTVVEKKYNSGNHSDILTAINAGVSGTGTAEQLVYLKNEGYKYHPDYIVLGFCDNDFRNNQISNLYKIENDSLVTGNKRYTPGTSIQNFLYSFKTFQYLGENSYLYGFAFNTIWNGVKKMRYKSAADKSNDKLTEYVTETRTEFSENDITLMTKLIEEMYSYSKEIGAQLIIIDIPKTDLKTSIPEKILPTFRANSDTLFYVNDLKSELSALTKSHVKHGHRHISEETHSLYAQKIVNFINSKNNK